MNNNYERGMIKWAPFNSLIPLNSIKTKIKEERNVISFPLLSEDELSIIQNNLFTAYHSKEEVIITYFYHNNLYELRGIIDNIISHQKLVILNKNIKLYFNQIIKVSLI